MWHECRLAAFTGGSRSPVTYANSGEPSTTRTCEPLVKYRLLYQRRAAIGLLNLTEKIGAGDGDRTRNFQLGNQNFRSFIFTTYETAKQKSMRMLRIPCM